MANRTFVPLTVYLDPDISERVDIFAESINNSKSAAGELLIKRGLGLVQDVSLEDMFKAAKKGSHDKHRA